MKLSQFAILLTLSLSALTVRAADQPALNEKLKPLQWVIGNWEGTSKDENLGQLTWKYEIKPDLGGNVVHLRYEAFDKDQHGIVSGIGLYRWHAERNGFVATGVGSLGHGVDYLVQQSGDKWIWQGYGYDNDGKYATGLTEVEKVDENTMAISFSRQVVAGQPVPDVKTTMKRVTTSPEEEVMSMERKYGEAVIKRDVDALKIILADEYVGASGAETWNKEQLMGFLRASDYRLKSVDYRELNARVYGDAATVHARISSKEQYKGQEQSVDVRVTETWIKRDGRWQMVSLHSSEIKPEQSSSTVEQEIIKLENELNDAFVASDIKAQDRILADEWTETEEDGAVTTKESLLADLKSGKLKCTYAKLDQPKVRVYGDAAVATLRNDIKGSYDGEPYAGQYRLTDTWIKRDGRWQCVASHASKIQAGVSANSSVEQEIIKLEKQFNEAMLRSDVEAIDNLLAQEWVESDEEGVRSKEDFLQVVKSGDVVVQSIDMQQPKVLSFGDTAVALFTFKLKGTNKGKEFTEESRATDTWIKRDGRWQCLAIHESKVTRQ